MKRIKALIAWGWKNAAEIATGVSAASGVVGFVLTALNRSDLAVSFQAELGALSAFLVGLPAYHLNRISAAKAMGRAR